MDKAGISISAVLSALFPLVVLIYMMTKKKSVPSNIALPVSAGMVYAIHLVYLGSDPNLINSTVVKGILGALTRISIIWGAVLLTKTMRLSGAGQVVRGLKEWVEVLDEDSSAVRLMTDRAGEEEKGI